MSTSERSVRRYNVATLVLEAVGWLTFTVNAGEAREPFNIGVITFAALCGAVSGSLLQYGVRQAEHRKRVIITTCLLQAVVMCVFALLFRDTSPSALYWRALIQYVTNFIGTINQIVFDEYLSDLRGHDQEDRREHDQDEIRDQVRATVSRNFGRFVALSVVSGVILLGKPEVEAWIGSITGFAYWTGALANLGACWMIAQTSVLNGQHEIAVRGKNGTMGLVESLTKFVFSKDEGPCLVRWIVMLLFANAVLGSTYYLLPAFLEHEMKVQLDHYFFLRFIAIASGLCGLLIVQRRRLCKSGSLMIPAVLCFIGEAVVQAIYPWYRALPVLYVIYAGSWILWDLARLFIAVESRRYYRKSRDRSVWVATRLAERVADGTVSMIAITVGLVLPPDSGFGVTISVLGILAMSSYIALGTSLLHASRRKHA